MKKIEITQETLNNIVAVAFKSGELWGVTYSTWFSPTDEDTADKIKECQLNMIDTLEKTVHTFIV